MAACVADRSSDQGSVGEARKLSDSGVDPASTAKKNELLIATGLGEAIGYICGEFRSFNCTGLPSFCSEVRCEKMVFES